MRVLSSCPPFVFLELFPYVGLPSSLFNPLGSPYGGRPFVMNYHQRLANALPFTVELQSLDPTSRCQPVRPRHGFNVQRGRSPPAPPFLIEKRERCALSLLFFLPVRKLFVQSGTVIRHYPSGVMTTFVLFPPFPAFPSCYLSHPTRVPYVILLFF